MQLSAKSRDAPALPRGRVPATLNGTLSIVLVDGFVPSSGQSFQVMTWSSNSRAFSTINNPMSATFTVSYLALDLKLTAN
jgi:hypothetical protein